jgi:hypothetical protein
MRGAALLVGMLGTWAAGAAGDEAIAPAGGFNRPRTSQDPGAAEAENTPTSYVDRPLTLPGGHLALGSSFGWLHADLPASTFLGTPASSLDALAVSLGARYGITDGLELDLLLPGLALAIQPARPAQGVNPALSLRAILRSDNVEFGLIVGAFIPVFEPRRFEVEFELPVALHFPGVARLASGLTINAATERSAPLGASVPLTFELSLSPHFAATLGTSFLLDFNTASYAVPLSVGAAITLGDPAAFHVDLSPSFRLPAFLVKDQGPLRVSGSIWYLNLGLEFYLGELSALLAGIPHAVDVGPPPF